MASCASSLCLSSEAMNKTDLLFLPSSFPVFLSSPAGPAIFWLPPSYPRPPNRARSVPSPLFSSPFLLPPFLTTDFPPPAELRPLLASSSTPSPAAVNTAFSTAFRATDAGPEFTTCFLAVEDCVNSAVLVGSQATCVLEEKCRALGERKRGWFF